MLAILNIYINSLRVLTRQDLVDYVNSHYKAPRMVLSAAGGRQTIQGCSVSVCGVPLNFYFNDLCSIWCISSAGVNHEELVALAKSHLSGVSFEYEGDAVPVLSPCRFTGSEVRCSKYSLKEYFSLVFEFFLIYMICISTTTTIQHSSMVATIRFVHHQNMLHVLKGSTFTVIDPYHKLLDQLIVLNFCFNNAWRVAVYKLITHIADILSW